MELTLLLMPKFHSIRKELGIQENEDYDSDAIRVAQGYNMEQMTIESGEEFTIGRKWESAFLQCEGNTIRYINKNDKEGEDNEEDAKQIRLATGNYFFNGDGEIIEKLSDLDNDDDH